MARLSALLALALAACGMAGAATLHSQTPPAQRQAEVLTLPYTPGNSEAAALIRLGLTLHALGDGQALLGQEGVGNAASHFQQGIGNLALIDQRGRDHSADLVQTGGGNARILLQSGRGASARPHQFGDALAITLQHGW